MPSIIYDSSREVIRDPALIVPENKIRMPATWSSGRVTYPVSGFFAVAKGIRNLQEVHYGIL